MPGSAALAVLLPTARVSEPLKLSLGGPIRKIEQELNRIKILEDAVGVPLFRRCDFSLTAEGVEYLRDVRDALTVLRRRFVR